MPGSCEADGCSNNSLMSANKPSFHRFPKDVGRKERWTNALKKLRRDGSKWEPSAYSRICGNHFIFGKPNSNPTHPDYIPSLFKHKNEDQTLAEKKILRLYEWAKRRKPNSPSSSEHVHSNEPLNTPPSDAPLNTPSTSSSATISCASPVSHTEREMIYLEMDALRAERDAALKKLEGKLKKASDNGKPNNDPNHPDYVPTLFPYNKKDWNFHKKKILAVGRYDRHVKRTKKTQGGSASKRKKATSEKETPQLSGQVILQNFDKKDEQAVWLCTVQGGKVLDTMKCPGKIQLSRQVNRPPLSAIMKANLLQPSSSSTTTTPATHSSTPSMPKPATHSSTPSMPTPDTNSSATSMHILDTNSSAIPIPTLATNSPAPPVPLPDTNSSAIPAPILDTNNSAPPVVPTLATESSAPPMPTQVTLISAPATPKVMPPCTQTMLFDEITALRSERDRALVMVAEMRQKMEAMTRKLKNKNERLQKHNCSSCHKRLFNASVHMNTVNSQQKKG